MHFVDEIIQRLEANSSNKSIKMAAYMKDKFVFYGVTSPIRKQICKEVYAEYGVPENAIEIAKQLFLKPQRECHYVAQELLIKAKKQWKEHHIEDIEWFITTHSWWDTVDHLASNVVGTYFKKWPQNQEDIVRYWNKSDNMWLVRTSIIYQLKYKNEVDSHLLASCILPHTQDKEFFIKKAIGWALRSYADVNPDWVISFVQNNDLQPLSAKEALRKL
jgi:3-methyladenine DNA glycosylase AlkD